MTTLEQVEKLRERANVSFEEAKSALEESGGDLLDALILLERQGKTSGPESGGHYSGNNPPPENGGAAGEKKSGAEGFKNFIKGLGNLMLNLINRGNSNYLDAIHRGETKLSCPVTVLVILLICFFWVIVPLLVVGLFLGWRYRFRGDDLGRESINNVIEKAETAAEDLKNSVTSSK